MGPLEKEFGVRLRQLRTEAGLTQQDLAKRAELDYKVISGIEAGRNVTLKTIQRLASALGVPPREFFLEAPKTQLSGSKYKKAVLRSLIEDLDPSSSVQVIRLIRHLNRLSQKPKR